MAKVKQPELAHDIRNTQDVRSFVYQARISTSTISGKPDPYDVFYNNKDAYNEWSSEEREQHKNGISPCRQGNTALSSYDRRLNVLPNCVGYACGRFNEIICRVRKIEPEIKYPFAGDAYTFYGIAKTSKWSDLKVGQIPKLGAILCWSKNNAEGHVAIVERLNNDGSIVTSESGWGMGGIGWKNETRYKGSDGKWIDGCQWMSDQRNAYNFQGFIYNPAIPDVDNLSVMTWVENDNSSIQPSGALPEELANNLVEYEEVTETIQRNGLQSIDYAGEKRTRQTSLLTFPTNVESPFIILKVGDFTFGNYAAVQDGTRLTVTYPNFIKSMEVVKINGRLNQYTIQLVYQIQPGNDPNLLDKIFGKVGYGKVKISYGDYKMPNFIYKEEEAIITNLNSQVDFGAARITYTLKCTSTALGLISNTFTFPYTKGKPSKIITDMLYRNPQYGLLDIFTGMTNETRVKQKHWIAMNDKEVELQPKNQIDPISYINYLVSCMIATTNSDDAVLLDSSYYMSIIDDAYGEQGGPYFTVKQVKSDSKTLALSDVYEVDIGFPSESLVTKFNVNTDNSWALLYKYSGYLQNQDYIYNIDNNGKVYTEYSPAFSTSLVEFNTSPPQRNWWTQVTKFPVSATLTIKGLLRPAMLMTAIRVNAFFYGKKHIASGLYFVTKQTDLIDASGYRTVLNLTRFAGDNDYITAVEDTVTYQRQKGSAAANASKEIVNDYRDWSTERSKDNQYLPV